MGVATFAFMGLSFTKQRQQRLFHYITAAITLVATIAYFCMGANLGWTAIQVEFERSDAKVAGTMRQIFYVRYIDWFITTPLLLLDQSSRPPLFLGRRPVRRQTRSPRHVAGLGEASKVPHRRYFEPQRAVDGVVEGEGADKVPCAVHSSTRVDPSQCFGIRHAGRHAIMLMPVLVQFSPQQGPRHITASVRPSTAVR